MDAAPVTPPRPLYLQPRVLVLFAVGLASGLPNVLTQDTLKGWLSKTGIDVAQIGLFGLVTFPYTFKFLWAPLLDSVPPPILGRRRGWLVVMQVALVLGLVAMACLGPRDAQSPLLGIGIAAAFVVFASASQDIVADAYRADVLEPRELGAGAAIFVAGYRVAMILAGAVALLVAQHWGWPAAYFLMAGLMLLAMAVTLVAPEPARGMDAHPTFTQAVVEPAHQFAQRLGPLALLVFVFVFLFRLPDVLGNAMTMPLLVKHLGYSLADIGAIRQFLGFFLTVVGALVGGALVARLGMIRALWVFGILQAVSNEGFLVLALTGRDIPTFIAVVVVENFCGGLVAAGFVAYLMSQCDARYSAAQYALLSALMAAPGLLLGSVTGYLVREVGYPWFFAITILAGAPGMMLLPWIARTIGAEPSAPPSR